MLKKTKIAFLVTALSAGAAFANTSATVLDVNQTVAREASEGARGEGGKRGGHPAIEIKDQLAKNGADDAAGDDRGGRRGGKGKAIELNDQLAKRGADDRAGDDRGGKRKAIELNDQLAKNGADDGADDDAGDDHGGRG